MSRLSWTRNGMVSAMVVQDSPTTIALRAGPRGNGDWPGWVRCYRLIYLGCERMARQKYVHLSDDHVQSMADLGSGHEERMKARMHWMVTYGYVSWDDVPMSQSE
jgi:hypothetical protein